MKKSIVSLKANKSTARSRELKLKQTDEQKKMVRPGVCEISPLIMWLITVKIT